jgi:hypothetical protein
MLYKLYYALRYLAMNGKIGIAIGMFALWSVALAGAYGWSLGIAGPEQLARSVWLAALSLIPFAVYRDKRPTPCSVKVSPTVEKRER